MGRKSEEQKQQEALNRWINVSDETYDVFSRWQYMTLCLCLWNVRID